MTKTSVDYDKTVECPQCEKQMHLIADGHFERTGVVCVWHCEGCGTARVSKFVGDAEGRNVVVPNLVNQVIDFVCSLTVEDQNAIDKMESAGLVDAVSKQEYDLTY